MDKELAYDARARRAIPLIAAALTVIVVAGLIYLRANPPPPQVLLGPPAVPQLAPDYWASYAFISPSLGWAGIVRQSGAPTVWVFRTTDGARHWQRQYTAKLLQGAPPSIQFFDRDHGIFFAGRLYRTLDGGADWEVISLPDATPDFAFGSPTRGWALTSTSNLYSTTDGGLTWRLLGATIPQAVVYGQGGLITFAFRPDGEGWAAAAGPTPFVYLTTDAGASWRMVPLQMPKVTVPSGEPRGPSYITQVELIPGNGVIATVIPEGFGAEVGFTSFDRGVTWHQAHEPPAPASFADLSFLDEHHWWASRWGTLFKTSDAGQTWTNVHVIAPSVFNDWTFQTAQVIDSRHAWMKMTGPQAQYESTALAMTSDGGVHWTAVNVPQAV